MKAIRAIAFLLSIILVFSACSNKESEIGPSPTATTSGNLAGVVGSKVQISAEINAPEGIKQINVLKNGIAFDAVKGGGQLTLTYKKEYIIENLPSGSIVSFTIQVVDTKNQTSILTPITLTVKAVAIVEVSAGSLAEGNVKWTADKIYKLKGFVRVGEEVVKGKITKRTVLTIEAGTLIIGDRTLKGTLIVQRGSKIIANGTVDKPIVMTSERNPGDREAGDWGGLVICGQAPNNLSEDDRELEGGYGAFHGGTNSTDSSGTYKYVRVEYAGIPISPNQEINSCTFGSVGTGTVVDYVQASFGLDDSFEWFGGNVNCKHLIAYKGQDDDFDTDNGYSGYIQYGIGIRGANLADQSGSNGFESDNDVNGSTRMPFTAAVFANMTIIGPKGAKETSINPHFQHAAQLRRNSKQKIYNTVMTGYPWGIYLDSQLGDAKGNANNSDIDFQNVVLIGIEGWGDNFWGTDGAINYNPKGVPIRENEANDATPIILIGTKKPSNWFTGLKGNKTLGNRKTSGLNDNLWQSGRPAFALATSGTDLLNATLPITLPTFFDKTDYVGAFKDTDWTATWAEFNPQTVVYVK